MKIVDVQRRVSPLVIAVLLLAQLSPAVASGQQDGQQGAIHGSRPVEVTFTKWRTAVIPPPSGVATSTRILFKGVVGGDLGDGDLVAEVLDRKASTACTTNTPCPAGSTPITGSIVALHAIYEVQVGDHSFTALIQGGTGVTGAALLDGVILAGWRTGARVHVTFQTISSCDGQPAGPCYQGVIRVGRAPEE